MQGEKKMYIYAVAYKWADEKNVTKKYKEHDIIIKGLEKKSGC